MARPPHVGTSFWREIETAVQPSLKASSKLHQKYKNSLQKHVNHSSLNLPYLLTQDTAIQNVVNHDKKLKLSHHNLFGMINLQSYTMQKRHNRID